MSISDLTPDALALLEVKLLADLDVVRRVRSLLEADQKGRSASSGARGRPRGSKSKSATSAKSAPAAKAPAPTGKKVSSEIIAKSLAALASDNFRTDDLRKEIAKAGVSLDSTKLRIVIKQLVREGSVAVAKQGVGRSGSLYRRTGK